MAKPSALQGAARPTLAVDIVAVAVLEGAVLALDLIAAATAARVLVVGVRQGGNVPAGALRNKKGRAEGQRTATLGARKKKLPCNPTSSGHR